MTTVEKNAWRLETPGVEGWSRTARPDDPHKYFMVSADCHTTESLDFLDGVAERFRSRVPHVETTADGTQFLITEGNRPQLVKPGTATPTVQERQSFERPADDRNPRSRMEEEDLARVGAGRSVEQRLADQEADGVDVEILFPTSGLLCWATPDPVFAMEMCRAWNRWAVGQIGEHMLGEHPRILPMALIASGDIEGAMAEIEWAAGRGYRGVCLGNSPTYGPTEPGKLQYNDPLFESMWSLLEETGLVITFHVSSGRDPRAVGGRGGAIINYVCHSMETTIEPLVQMITAGVFERHPRLQAGLVESGIGFVPWLLETMDHAYRAHHFWVRPVIPELPSSYFRRNCFATFQQDAAGLMVVEALDLVDNMMWANDYPHHEGVWPHSAASIERTMGHLTDGSRAKILGLNAARVFGLDVPAVVCVVTAAPEAPLEGVRVLDLSRAIAGPYPARILADLGADVVKAEPPEGDITDLFGKQQAGRSGLFAQMNVGKRNLLLDLGAPDDAALARRLAAVADVVVENFKVGVMARFGLGYDVLSAANPRLIMLSVTGFGQYSPEAGRRAFAPVLHAESGLLVRQSRFDEAPVTDLAFNAADTFTGLHGAIAVLAALQLRERTGRGQHIDMAMLDAVTASDDYVHYVLDDVPAVPSTGMVFDLPGGPMLLAGDVKFFWWALAKRHGLVDDGGGTLDDKRVRREAILTEWMASFADRSELVAHLEEAGLTWADVRTPEDLFNNATYRARPPFTEVADGLGGTRPVVRLPYRFSDAAAGVRGSVAQRDEHRAAVCQEWLGWSE